MPFPSRPLRIFLAALAIVGGVWGAEAATQRELTLLSSGKPCVSIAAPSGGIYDSTNLSSWSVTRATKIVGNAASPDCKKDATTVIEDTSNNTHYVSFGLTHNWVATSVSYSVYVQQGVGTRQTVLYVYNSSFSAHSFVIAQPSSCTITQAASTNFAGATASSTNIVSGKFCVITLTFGPFTDTSLNLFLEMAVANINSYQGDGVSSLIYWDVDVR